MAALKSSVNIKIPVLMYHEVSREISSSDPHKMTPMYNISEGLFEEQIRALSINGYRSVYFDEAGSLPSAGKYVIITFDDGFSGNIRFALPILKKYGFKAVFFVAVDSIGTPGYMRWPDLLELRDSGMSVQSHTMSHRSLQTLSENEVAYELQESKRMLEDKLGVRITSISFPHGSYNQMVIRTASSCGYEFLCTSESVRTFNTSFREQPAVLGRITITSKLTLEKFLKLVEYNGTALLNEKLAKGAKNFLKRVIGINTYRKIYRLFFNIKVSS